MIVSRERVFWANTRFTKGSNPISGFSFRTLPITIPNSYDQINDG